MYVLGRNEDIHALSDLSNLDQAIDCLFWPHAQPLPDDACRVVILWHSSLAECLPAPNCPPILICGQLDNAPLEIGGVATVRVLSRRSQRTALLQILMCTVLSTAYKGLIGVDDADVELLLRHGGAARIFAHRGLTIRSAGQGLRSKSHRALRAMAPNAALSLTICAPPGRISLRAVDLATAWALEPANFGSFSIVALLASPQRLVHMWLLAIDQEST